MGTIVPYYVAYAEKYTLIQKAVFVIVGRMYLLRIRSSIYPGHNGVPCTFFPAGQSLPI